MPGVLPIRLLGRFAAALGRFGGIQSGVALRLLAWGFAGLFAQSVSASPFISEIFLPETVTASGSAVELSGIGESGATLLVVNARPDQGLVVRRKFEVFTPGTVLLGESSTVDTLVPPPLSANTQELPPFSLPLSDPVGLVLFAGTTQLQPGVGLGQPQVVAAELALNPIVDWVFLGPGPTQATAEAGLLGIDDDLAAALGLVSLPRPVAPIQEARVWARAILDGAPRLDTLLPGSIDGGILGTSAQLNDFPASPAGANPGTLARPPGDPEDGGTTPEPGGAALALMLGVALARRSARPRCWAGGRGL